MLAAFYISGHVQGVAYRHHALTRAQRLSIRSAVAVNLPDGRVYVCAEGDAENLKRLEQDLRGGPPMARVEGVEPAPTDAFGPLERGFASR